MRTTLELPDELFKQAKIQAVQKGLPLKELIRDYVERGLQQDTLSPPPPVRTRRGPPPVIPARPGPPPINLTNEKIDEIFEAEDLDDFRASG